MRIQLIFCVEADGNSGTDWVYIKSVLYHYFVITNSIIIKPVFMGGKGNYRKQKVIKKIRDRVKTFDARNRDGKTIVLYCIDTDDLHKDSNRRREFEDISKYCDENGYELIWFCRDVEEVFWGERISGKEKLKYASKFRQDNRVEKVDVFNIESNKYAFRTSNILSVLERHLQRQR